jgi:iron complex outermembrane receptor protein
VITKQPLPFWYANGTLIGGNYGYISPSLDISGPITPGKQLLFRFNTAYQHQDSFVDFVDSDTFQIAPVLTWIIGPDTVITFEGEYQALSDLYYTGLPAQGTIQANINGKIPRSRYLGDKKLEGENFPERTQGIIGYRFEHIFNEHVTLKNGFFVTIFDTDERDVIPEFLDVDERTMFRSLFEATSSREDYYISTDLIFRFNTGPVGHQLLAGSDQRFNYTDSRSATAEIEPIDVFDPVYGNVVNPIGPDTPRRLLSTSGTFIGFYLQDLVTITDQVRVLLGLRYDIAEQDSMLRFTEDPAVVRDKFDDDVFSPLAGVVYQPLSFIALYANYTESFNPVSGTNRTGKQFKPESGIQFEGGAKFEFFDGRLFSTMAVYQITKENILTPDPEDELFSVQIGEQRSRGFEFDISGQVLPGLSLIASYAYTDARITKSNPEFGFEIEGNRPANVPKHSGTVWTVYDFYKGPLTGLSTGAGVIAVGKREADIFDSGMLPAYARVDALVGYKVNKYFDLAVNIKNLFDTKYYETSTFGVWENGISPGAPFTIFATLSLSYY